MISDRENQRLSMKMTDAGHLHAARGDPESGVLYCLELVNSGSLGVREPGRGVEGFDKGFKSY